MQIPKDYIKQFKKAQKSIHKEFKLDAIRHEDIVTVKGKYAYSFSDTEETVTAAHIEAALRMTILEMQMDEAGL